MTTERTARISADAEDLGQGLGRLVLAVLDLVRQLLERQALRRVDAGSLTEAEVERLGRALMDLEDRFGQLRTEFGVRQEDLELRLPFDAGALLAEDRTTHHRREDTP
jgi:hypothetical protein